MINWIKDAVFYEIYPTSFYDSNNDGVGDLKGIIKKIDYIKSLGVNAVWFNPFFLSPFKDGGYDVQDYLTIDPRFGTMKDLDELIKVFHKNKIRVVLDLVIGHTSDQHKWFIESCKSKRNKYSDYYIWTNEVFKSYGGKTLHGLAPREGGYYVNFFASQPGLNFGFAKVDDPTWQLHYKDKRLKPLRDEIINIMRFYLKKGVDGFRVDMAASLVKNDPTVEGLVYVWKELLKPIRKEFPEAVYIAEWSSPFESIGMCGFDIDLLLHDIPAIRSLSRCEENLNQKPEELKERSYFDISGKGTFKIFSDYYKRVIDCIKDKGAVCVQTGCHDVVRIASYKNINQLKAFYAFLYTFRFVPLLYYGDEIEMKHNRVIETKDGGYYRTGSRTPMQWNASKNRGFSKAKTLYLPVSNEKGIDVESKEKDKSSLLNLTKTLIALRKKYSCLGLNGKVEIIENDYPTIYKRVDKNNTIYIYLNPSCNKVVRRLPENSNLLVSNNIKLSGDMIELSKQSFAIILTK